MSDINESVKQFYDKVGTHFSRTRQKTYGNGESSNWPITDKYLKKLKSGMSVLDLGCGNGKLVSGLPSGVEYIGTDFSRTLIDEAKKLYPKHDFRLGDVVDKSHWQHLGKYDAIYCVAVLHHIGDPKEQTYVLSQCKQHLKNNGFLYLTVWNLWQEKFLQYQVDDHFEIPYNHTYTRYCVSYDVANMTKLMTEAGFEDIEIFFADREGKKVDILSGENMVVVGTG